MIHHVDAGQEREFAALAVAAVDAERATSNNRTRPHRLRPSHAVEQACGGTKIKLAPQPAPVVADLGAEAKDVCAAGDAADALCEAGGAGTGRRGERGM